jgi:transposase
MANKTIQMSKVRQILKLYTQGQSKNQISLLTGASRNTIKKYLRKFAREQLTFEIVNAMTDHELNSLFGAVEEVKPDNRYVALVKLLPDIEKQMKRKGMTLQKVWEQYRAQQPDGYAITQFYKYYKRYNKSANPAMHMEHKAGDKMFIDFAGDKLHIIDKNSGEIREVELFAAILGCSQLTYVEAVYSQKKEDLIKGCENAIHYFGGVPAAIVPDNLRAAVTKSSRYEPVINETFADFADHYGTSIIPARTYRPKDKSLVEGIIKIVYVRMYAALKSNTYYSLEELNQDISVELEKLNNAAFKGRDYSRRQQFEEVEKSALQQLPAYLYELKQQAMATVMKNGHVCLGCDKHYYSVPCRFIGRKVKVLYSSTQVEVFYHYERITLHQRDLRKYQYTTAEEHLASSHRYVSDWTPEKFIEQGNAINEQVAEYLSKVLETKNHPEQAYKSCSGILNLARKVGNQRLINACKRAMLFGIYNYPILLQILEKNLDHFSEEETTNLFMPQHTNIRGGGYYE